MLRNTKDVLTAQIDAIHYPTIQAHTDSGKPLTIETNKKQRDDPAFWQVISAILKAHLWVPVSKPLHELFESDWLSEPTA